MRVTKDAAERRQEILDVSLELLLERGYEKTSVKDIVTKVGVAQGLFYYYFSSKEELVKEICAHYKEKYFELLASMGLNTCGDVVEAMRLLLAGTFKFVEMNNRLLIKMHEKGNKTLHDTVTNFFIEAMAKTMAGIIELGNSQDVFNCEYPDKCATALIYGIFVTLHDDEKWTLGDNIEAEKDFIFFYLSRVLSVDRKIFEEILK